jgi:broad specificity phosphatase PhoE
LPDDALRECHTDIKKMRRSVYFITHPNVQISRDVPVPRWPLSELGCARMREGLRMPWVKDITAIYCSTEQKAIDGARLLADHLSIDFTELEALGENDRTATGFLEPAEFERVADEFFANPETSIRGWERAMDAQSRVVFAVERIASADTSAGDIAVVSHGAVGTLLYCHLSRQKIERRWDQPPNGGGNYFCFSIPSLEVYAWWRAIDEFNSDEFAAGVSE